MAQPSDLGLKNGSTSSSAFLMQDIKLPGMSESQPPISDETAQKIASLLKSRTLEGPSLTEFEDPSFVVRAVSAPTGLGSNTNRRQQVRRLSTPDGGSWRSCCVKGVDLFGGFEPIPALNTAGFASEQAEFKIEASEKCIGR